MIANYFIIDDFLLKEMQMLGDIKKFDKIEYMLDNEEFFPYCDIDDIWHGLYFLLSSTKDMVIDKRDLMAYSLSVFIFGATPLSDKEHIYYTNLSQMKQMIEQIEQININEKTFDKVAFAKASIYPNIWSKEDKELLCEELKISFEELKTFYTEAITRSKSVLITII